MPSASRNHSPRTPPKANSFRDELGVFSPVDPGDHPALQAGRVAVITGAASGIGLAAARELASEQLKIVLADIDEPALQKAGKEIAQLVGESNVLVVPTDVSKLDQVEKLRERVYETFGEVSLLINNAGVGGSGFEGLEKWKAILDTNLWGVLNVQETFVKGMMYQENPSIIINTGSKQGLTNPPGNTAYNASKAAVRVITEGLAHEMRERHATLTPHLFIPGWTFTGMTGANDVNKEKPDGAWTAQQTVQYMLRAVRAGQFYIVCPDNETSSELDKLRIRWGAEDIIAGRPALSRWHPEYKPLFEEYIREGLA